jgi:pimeloyl-ACP methyl ester carboxylesterase
MQRESTGQKLTLFPFILKTHQFQMGRERQRIAAEFGRLRVPERRSHAGSNEIELAFVRVKSTAQHPGPPLVYLAGGPGLSGIDELRWERLVPWFLTLRELGDVIALDQRGAGLSLPCLECLETWDLPLEQAGSYAQVLSQGRKKMQSSVAFWQGQGVDLTGYTTAESADDIDALREALGYAQINLYGASYGSHLALATIKRHPTRIARAVIAMVEGPDHTAKLPSNVQQHLAHLQELVLADPKLCTAIPDLLGLMQAVLTRLEADPVTVEIVDEKSKKPLLICLGKFDLQWITARGIGSRRFIANLPARYYAMAQGDFSWLADQVYALRRSWIGNAMSYAMDCASGVSPERARRVEQEAEGTLLGKSIDFPFMEICDVWGMPDLGPAYRAALASDTPALFLSGSLDGRTPASNAEEVRNGFSHSQHLIVKNAAHSTAEIVAAPGITQAIIDFLQEKPVIPTEAAVPFTFTPLSE